MRLEDVLRQLPERELASLVHRMRIRIDEAKRIDVASQVARALLLLPETRDPTQLPPSTRELVYRLVEGRGVLFVEELPPGLDLLVGRGICYVRQHERGVLEILLPIAFMVQLKTWEGEDQRGIRALLSQLSAEVAQTVASNYLGRQATPPLALSLEPAWDALTDPAQLATYIAQLSLLERKLLRGVEEVGGEVDTEELLELEREPLRLRGAGGATPSRRGVGFALERRGLLIPVHPNRHIVPTEVVALVGAQRLAEREAERLAIRSFVLGDDHAPRRARFAEDPMPLVMAMALAVREGGGSEVRDGVGTPKSLLLRLANRFGRSPESLALLAALSRSLGLWEPSAIAVAGSPGSLAVHELPSLLFKSWRRGGAWDEARTEGEALRLAADARDASSALVVREMVIEALTELTDGTWAPWDRVLDYVRADGRGPGVTRLLTRWAARNGVTAPSVEAIATRVALESLHILGVVDLGESDSAAAAGVCLRITPRGRALLRGAALSLQPEPSRFVDTQTLRIGAQTRIGQILVLAPFIDVGAVTGSLDLLVTQQAIAMALSAGVESDVVRQRLETVAALPEPIERMLTQASAVVGRAEFVESSGFLWVEDPEVRELLRTRRQTSELFVEPSPPSGLLVVAGVELDKLARRCRTLGVELLVSGGVYRTRSMAPNSGRGSGPHRVDSATGLTAVRPDSKSPPRRRSSASALAAVKRTPR